MRRFPPPWTVEALDSGFKIVDYSLLALNESEMYIPAAIVSRALVRGWRQAWKVIS